MNFNQSVHIKHGRCSKMQLHGILSKMKTDRDSNVSLICIVLFNPLTYSFVNFFYIALKSSKPCQPFLSSYSVSWEQHIIQNLNSDCNNPGRWQSLLPFSSFRLTAFSCCVCDYVLCLFIKAVAFTHFSLSWQEPCFAFALSSTQKMNNVLLSWTSLMYA